jgi:glycine cleavage system H lipoate-binding protein
MSAGLVAYQLCDNGMDCETCPLDIALRRRSSRPVQAAVKAEPVAEVPAMPEGLRRDYQYNPNHCWQKNTTGRTIRVGLEPGLASSLLVPKAVVLPAVGQYLLAGQPCVWIIMEEGTFQITAIADGTVTAHNSSVVHKPQDLFLNPYEDGWLYEFLPDPGHDSAVDSVTAFRQYEHDMFRFHRRLDEELGRVSISIGATMADGGKPLHNISSILGPKAYGAILREIFGGRQNS